jgi:hypothetical protein
MLTDKKIVIIIFNSEGQMFFAVILTGRSTDMDTSNALIDDNFVSLEHSDQTQKERSRKFIVSHQIYKVVLSLLHPATLPGDFQKSRNKACQRNLLWK